MTALRAAVHPFRLALKAPLVTGGTSIRFRAGFLVALTADGLTGWGEASPLPGWSRAGLLDTETELRRACDELARGGETALRSCLAAMRDTPHARAGLAGAWADLQARRAEQRLAERLVDDPARPVAPEVAVNALIAAPEPSGAEQAAHDAVEAGFQAVKLKVGAAAPHLDVARTRAVRAGLGPTVDLRLDANGAWDEHTALDVLNRVRDCGISYCEEPVAGIDAMAAVSRRSPIPVAADESIRSESDAVRALRLGVGILIVKPQALGGPDVALCVAARAHEAAASATVTSLLDSAVGVTHALHVAAAVDSLAAAGGVHGLATSSMLSSDVVEPPPVIGGTMSLPPGYGIGVEPAQ